MKATIHAVTPDHLVAHSGRRRFLRRSLQLAPLAIGMAVATRTGQVRAAIDPIYTTLFSDKALAGYDAVAYFTEQRAVEGSSAHRFEWRDASWQFASRENLEMFAAAPERYAPAYGGYCAYAMAQGATAKGDPEQWTVIEDRLYVNYDADVKALWRQDTAGYIEKADQNWPVLLNS